jgi:S-DNA-T family DNA segregation ATPase FtsK/SpoIIIE
MKMANKKIKRKAKKTQQLNVAKDVAAILLAAFSIFLLLTSFKPEASGIVGSLIAKGFLYLFGIGTYAVPVLLLIYAFILLTSTESKFNFSFAGLIIIYISFLSIVTLYSLHGSYFELDPASKAGGIVGSIFAFPVKLLFGKIGAYIIFSSLSLAGILITINRPLSEIYAYLKRTEKTGEKEPARTKTLRITEVLRKPEKTVKVERPELTQPIDFEEEEEELGEEKEGPIITAEEVIQQPKTEGDYILPPLSLLRKHTGKFARTVTDLKKVIETTLADFNIPAKVVGTQEGPTVTTFEVQLEPGVPVRKLTALQEDIALALATPHIRIITPLPGKSAVGIEVPNKSRELVTLGDLLDREEWLSASDPLFLAIGKDISGSPLYFSLKKMPHMLIAGATGSGKSVCLNSIILTILFKAKPDQVKMVLIDPKRVEFTPYNDIPHLMAPVVVDPKQASAALNYLVEEMEERYKLLSSAVARDIDSYNKKAYEKGLPNLPYIVVIIDELADLMLVCSREVEDSIVRLAQMARAVGIHLIVATQRPSANIITGLIKSNITTRIAFSVGSQIDSRVILDTTGAEKLVGQGDMLFITQSLRHPTRLQAPYVSEAEIEAVTSFVKSQAKPEYVENIFEFTKKSEGESDFDDELLDDAVELILNHQHASTSFLQRKLKIGYARAARIMDILEAMGAVSPQEGAKPRQILITWEDWERIKEARYDNR